MSLDNVHNFIDLCIVQYLCRCPLLPRLSFLSVTSCLQILPILLSLTLLGVETLGNYNIPEAVLLQSIFDGCPAIQNFTYCASLSEQLCEALTYALSLPSGKLGFGNLYRFPAYFQKPRNFKKLWNYPGNFL